MRLCIYVYEREIEIERDAGRETDRKKLGTGEECSHILTS